MNWYPQFGAGSVAQFPLGRTRKWRAITNWLENDERVLLADAASKEIEWRLGYRDLGDAEVASLTDLFAVSQGGFGAFGFIDPMANLLGWSGDLTQPDWNAGLLNIADGIQDPVGGSTAWVLSNLSSGVQSLQQTVGVPADYTACFSAWLWCGAPAVVMLSRDGINQAVPVGPKWTRGFVSGRPGGGEAQSVLSIGVPAGRTIRVWGMQAEAQPYPSQYKATTTAQGIYEETYFSSDELKVTSTAPGLSSCDVTLVSRG